MKVHNMLKQKGGTVASIQPDAQISAAVKMLEAKGIGALVVSADGKTVDGIISERDIVRALAGYGEGLLAMPVDTIMTGDVVTCTPEDGLNHIMAEMTQRRFRHMPVIEDGMLCGIVSIGDVVKSRLEELETETTVLREYIAGA